MESALRNCLPAPDGPNIVERGLWLIAVNRADVEVDVPGRRGIIYDHRARPVAHGRLQAKKWGADWIGNWKRRRRSIVVNQTEQLSDVGQAPLAGRRSVCQAALPAVQCIRIRNGIRP